MSYHYNLTIKNDHIRFDNHGEVETIDDARQFGHAAMSEALHHGRDRLLFYEKELVMNLTTHDVYLLAEEFADKLLHSGLRVAAVHADHNREVGQHFETMLRNRSFNYRSFVDEQEALVWLTS